VATAVERPELAEAILAVFEPAKPKTTPRHPAAEAAAHSRRGRSGGEHEMRASGAHETLPGPDEC